MSTKIVPNPTQMRRYLRMGLTHQQIADEYEKDTGVRCSRSSISMAISRYGLQSNQHQERYEDMIPWDVLEQHQRRKDHNMLRLEARRRRGLPLRRRDLITLNNWRQDLEDKNAVVIYEPNTAKGFWWVDRTPEDDDIIRRPRPVEERVGRKEKAQ